MSLETLSAIASVGTFVVIAATAIAAIIQLHHIRASNQIAGLNELREELESPEFRESVQIIRSVEEQIEDPAFRRDLETRPAPANVQRLLRVGRLFETLGGYVKHGILSEELVLDLWAPVIEGNWRLLAPATVVLRRVEGPALLENFEYLAVKSTLWRKQHPTSYPKNLPRIAPPDRWLAEDQARSVRAVGSCVKPS